MEKEQIRYLHKDGMARRINNEWVIDDLYKTEITFPMRVTIDPNKTPLLYEQQVKDSRYPYGKDAPISMPVRRNTNKPAKPSAEVIARQYGEEGMTLWELQSLYKRSQITIQSWIEEAGFSRKNRRARYQKQEEQS